MKTMKVTLFILTLCALSSVQANCPRCDRINAERAANPGPQYDYYEDYIKANPNEANAAKSNTTEPAQKTPNITPNNTSANVNNANNASK